MAKTILVFILLLMYTAIVIIMWDKSRYQIQELIQSEIINYYPINGSEAKPLRVGDTVRICSGFSFDTVVIKNLSRSVDEVQYFSVREGGLMDRHFFDRDRAYFQKILKECDLFNR